MDQPQNNGQVSHRSDTGKSPCAEFQLPSWRVVTSVLVSIISLGLQAQTVYKSIDAQGRTLYSDNPPDNAISIEEIYLRDLDSVQAPTSQELIEQMAATTARLKKDRLAREAERIKPPSTHYKYPPTPANGETPYYYGPQDRPLYYPRHFYRQRQHNKPGNTSPPEIRDNPRGKWVIPLRQPQLGLPEPLGGRRR